jgi:hypothetical protein
MSSDRNWYDLSRESQLMHMLGDYAEFLKIRLANHKDEVTFAPMTEEEIEEAKDYLATIEEMLEEILFGTKD